MSDSVRHTRLIGSIWLALMAAVVTAAALGKHQPPQLLGIPAEFLLFGLTLAGVAFLHHRTFEVALSGLGFILLLKFLCVPDFHFGLHVQHEAMDLTNLLGLLLGFAVLARHFEQSQLPELLPNYLPDDWKGGFVLLCMVFVLSAFLDNIAAAMIGGTIALHVYRRQVHIGFLAAIVAAANAGGSGSVLGDTTTTMMWIDGVAWTGVLHAYVAAVPALLFFGLFAARQQHRYRPIERDALTDIHARPERLVAVALILAGTILTNLLLDFPAAGVWIAILVCAPFVKTDWTVITRSLKGSLFLIALVLCASLMPVEALPAASWPVAFGLGFVSSVFDNIPLTKLALEQGGYDWGMLAYAVGFGGSMIWFGSSAGVAISNIYPQAKSVGQWLTQGWHVAVGYVIGFFVLLAILGWQPHEPHGDAESVTPVTASAHSP